MKVTALIPDELIADVKQLTDSLIKALSEWVSIQKIKSLNIQVARTPLVFKEGFSSSSVRKIKRQ